MKGITAVIDELGKIILEKDLEIKTKSEEIVSLKEKVERLERYLDLYDDLYNLEQNMKNI